MAAPVEVTVYDGSARIGGRARALRRARSLRSRRASTAKTARTTRTTRAGSRCSRAPRPSSYGSVPRAGSPFDVVHVHDWPGALVPLYLRELAKREWPRFLRWSSRFTTWRTRALPREGLLPTLGLGWDAVRPRQPRILRQGQSHEGWARRLAQAHHGLRRPTRARSRRPSVGSGLDGVLRARAADLSASTTASTTRLGTPRSMPRSPLATTPKIPRNKERCKTAILRELGLALPGWSPARHCTWAASCPKRQRFDDFDAAQARVRRGAGGSWRGGRSQDIVARAETAVARAPRRRRRSSERPANRSSTAYSRAPTSFSFPRDSSRAGSFKCTVSATARCRLPTPPADCATPWSTAMRRSKRALGFCSTSRPRRRCLAPRSAPSAPTQRRAGPCFGAG